MELQTDRLIIREYTPEDVDTVHRLVEPLEMYQYQHFGPNSYEDTQNFVNMCIRKQGEKPRQAFEMSITDKFDGTIVGAIGFRIQSIAHKKADLGYWVRMDRWGQGIATEATKAMIRFGFEDLEMNRISATASPKNPASIRVLQKSGMKKEGVLRQFMHIRGEYRDFVVLSVLQREYLAKS